MNSIRRLTRAILSVALDAWLWLVNVQMFAIVLLGRLVRRLSTERTPHPTPSESVPLP